MINNKDYFKDTTWEQISKAISPDKYIKPNPDSILKFLQQNDSLNKNEFLAVRLSNGENFTIEKYSLGDTVYITQEVYYPYSLLLTYEQFNNLSLDGTALSDFENNENILILDHTDTSIIEQFKELGFSDEQVQQIYGMFAIVNIFVDNKKHIVSYHGQDFIYEPGVNVIRDDL